MTRMTRKSRMTRMTRVGINASAPTNGTNSRGLVPLVDALAFMPTTRTRWCRGCFHCPRSRRASVPVTARLRLGHGAPPSRARRASVSVTARLRLGHGAPPSRSRRAPDGALPAWGGSGSRSGRRGGMPCREPLRPVCAHRARGTAGRCVTLQPPHPPQTPPIQSGFPSLSSVAGREPGRAGPGRPSGRAGPLRPGRTWARCAHPAAGRRLPGPARPAPVGLRPGRADRLTRIMTRPRRARAAASESPPRSPS